MEKLTHHTFEEALQRIASVLEAKTAEVKSALDAFYRKATPRKVKAPGEAQKISTEIVIRPDVRPPIISGKSVCMDIEGRLPVEFGRTESKRFDPVSKGMVLDSKVVARRMDLRYEERPYTKKNITR